MQIQPYLFFEGRCEEAIGFYRAALGATLLMQMRYGEAPEGTSKCPDGSSPPADKVMHASLQVGESQLMMSDGFAAGNTDFRGFALSLSASDDAEARRWFDALAAGGKIQQPLMSTFFASSFGMLVDRFGVSWMVLKQNAPPA